MLNYQLGIVDLGQVVVAAGQSSKETPCMPLGKAQRGFCGRIQAIAVAEGQSSPPAEELERRLVELGFIEGARVEILHEGIFGRDPIAVRVNDATVAIRRREAMAILVI
jgi:ferrous iron transport protein A